MSARRVAVLGAGIMGSAVSIDLARRGFDVTLIDRESEPMAATSRWNEGKIHLGYLYGADPTLATARHLLPGGLLFTELLSELIGGDVDGHATTDDDVYLVHRDSVVSADQVGATFDAISALVRQHPDAGRYVVDVSEARAAALTPAELRAVAGEDIVAGFRVPERSVDTRWVADRLAGAVAAESGVELRLGTTVLGVEQRDDGSTPWRVHGDDGYEERFDVVVNALWNGRLPIDVAAGLTPEPPWTHRFRLCVFLRTRAERELASAVVAVGPFGDVKNYNGRDFYLSWYPLGLIAQGTDLELRSPEIPSGTDAEAFVDGVRVALERVVPGVGRVIDDAEELTVEGGFVFARGRGALDDPRSGLHRRDRYGVQRLDSYYSVDTGKYSTAPWLAGRLAAEIAG